ncbi:MAG TPA: branched-chain-amino-acid transaminase [Verrucomicrobia subdivision 6 bacterium]|jgi:branched-chain amino acid aminotransferase|uniref:Branched-chain-amino-acid aminotransferase n=1 Tax=Verrucomicrobia subdivision 6 bacterium BACL9 MAG-120507-bin52 TaxID=1655590 RepID=A0A0R2RQL9_9BACT|nr:MAG: branched-chain amino acid aminotransferase [Verrucomicrobia subdivision 6 bacterium BACL9 MAG-120507-bin52]MDA0324099.1 branched-chain-amino-acid transaminase [Verrucomicrobiota bacterium]HBZ84783.1 branched-chain-amino-acid transaminase [Verrucomicrobia subdivision 6 bacterium]
MIIYIDGKFYPEEEAKISVFDHGLLYGDGVFEGIRAYEGRIFKLEEHLARLEDSAKAILLKLPLSRKEIEKAVLETCQKNKMKSGYLRLVVTRGKGYLGLSPDRCKKPTIIIIASDLELYPEKYYREGLKVVTGATWRQSPAALDPGIKSLNYLNNILAKIEGQLAGAQEVILLNPQGLVSECSGDNIFFIRHGALITPKLSSGALNGITRATVLEIARQAGWEAREDDVRRYDLFTCEEMFLTGTGAEIVPVVEVDGRLVGDGKPGKKTADLMKRYHKLVTSTGTKIPS